MAIRGSLVPSNYPSQFEQPAGILQSASRQPLTASAGNSQHQVLAQGGLYHDHKDYRHRSERTLYAIPTIVPSVPSPRQSVGHTWEQRRQRHRTARQQRYSRNPLADSPNYIAYRDRQNRDSNPEDAKWPEVLEMAFLDALVYIPSNMGRRKYSYRGKPHGRNELIREYIWLYYLRSLAPGQAPDPSMRRCRKQVSSHIQVLKGFFKDHPAFHTLFPKNKTPKNGFEDSFKNDPCLRALSEGRLPDQSPEQYAMFNQVLGMPMVSRTSTEPNVFWLLITSSSIPTDANGRNTNEEDLYHSGLVAHKYTSLSTQRPSDSIESIFNWRHRFPQLYHHHSTSSFSCEVIHMDVALCLMVSHPPEGAELVSRTEISLPNAGYDHESGMYLEDSTWRIATTLSKPAELCHNPAVDPPILNQMSIIPILSMNAQEARIKVPFPAMAWAHAFTSLTDLSQKPLTLNTVNTSHLLDEISMYQEVQWSPGPGVPFQRRAMILWTFRQSKDGEESCTTWRYLEMGNRGRHECMSPDLDHNQRLNASMHETFNTSFIGDTLETTAMDPFIQSHSLVNQTGLATPPATAGLQSPFGEHQQPVYALSGLRITNHFNIGGNSLSFESVTSVDNEATLVESNVAGNLDSFIGNNNASLASFDGGNQEWVLDGRGSSNAVDSFVSGNTNWTYSELQSASNSVTLHLGGWEDVATINTKGNNNWVLEEGLKGHEWTGRGMEERVKELEWVVELPAQANEDNEWESTRSQIDTVESVGQGANQEGLDEDGYEVVGNWIEERHDRHEDIDALSGLKDEEHAAYTFSSKKDEIKKELWEGIGEAGDEADPCEYLQLGDRSK